MSARSADAAASEQPGTLQSRLEAADRDGRDGGGEAGGESVPTIAEPVAFFRHLHLSGRFHRDSRLGRAYHRGMISLRENVATDSLHIAIEGDRVAAHMDRFSPLMLRSEGLSRYSVRQAVAHNVAGMAQDLVWMLRGRQGDHRCVLNCEWCSSAAQHAEVELLDPAASAWSVQLEARVAGTFEEARLRAALSEVLGTQSPVRDPLEVVDCDDDHALACARTRLQSMVLPVADFPPVHVCLARHPAGDVLMLNLNHAAADGFAARQVLHSIARAYTGEAEPAAPLEFLAVGGLPVRPASPALSALARSYKRAIEALRNLLDGTARVATDGSRAQPGYGFHLVSLAAEETEHMQAVKREDTSRKVLMAALHLAIGDWNLRHGTPGRRVGVLVPANLRPAGWEQSTIGNFSVTARVSTRRSDRAGPATALAAVSAQIARNQRTRTGVALIAALERSGLLELWAKQSTVVLQPLTGNRTVDAAMLCNLGWLDTAPSFGPDAGETSELWFSAPARSPLSLCLGVVIVGDRLHLTLRYPHRLFSPDAARRFADGYLEHVRLVAGGQPDEAGRLPAVPAESAP